MRLFTAVLAVLFVLTIVLDVEARGRRRNRRARNNTTYTNYTTTYSTTSYSQTRYSGGPQSVASSKASRAASTMTKGHLGGGFGGGTAEGVGFSTYSAQDALNNCCYTGQRSVAGSSVVRGADGWYAVKIYW